MTMIKSAAERLLNPDWAKKKLTRLGHKYVGYPLFNAKVRIKNREKNSTVGLVVNWGFHKFEQWPVAEYPFLLEAILEAFDPVIISSQRIYEKQKHEVDTIIGFEPDRWIAPRISYDTSCDHDIGIISGHPHSGADWFPEYVRKNDIQNIFSRYYEPFFHYFPDLSSRLIHFPWSMPKSFIVDPNNIEFYGQNKLNIFGTYGHEMYETREAIREYDFVNTSMRYDTGHGVSKPLGFEDYYRWCRNFDSMIAAGSLEERYQYTFAKYFEIPAAGALLFAQYCQDLERLGFDDSNSVIFNSLNEFEQKAEAYLDHPEKYLSRRQNGVKLVRNRHTVEDRIETLDDHLDTQK